jgi:hypothetical protein
MAYTATISHNSQECYIYQRCKVFTYCEIAWLRVQKVLAPLWLTQIWAMKLDKKKKKEWKIWPPCQRTWVYCWHFLAKPYYAWRVSIDNSSNCLFCCCPGLQKYTLCKYAIFLCNLSPCWSAFDFWKIKFEIWNSTNLIFGLFQNWFSLPV